MCYTHMLEPWWGFKSSVYQAVEWRECCRHQWRNSSEEKRKHSATKPKSSISCDQFNFTSPQMLEKLQSEKRCLNEVVTSPGGVYSRWECPPRMDKLTSQSVWLVKASEG